MTHFPSRPGSVTLVGRFDPGLTAMLMRALITTLVSLSTLVRAADAPPGTDIWVAPLHVDGAGVTVGEARNITARAGYDNQPAFVSPEVFLFTSFAAANGQT